jgi:hypothetical protein
MSLDNIKTSGIFAILLGVLLSIMIFSMGIILLPFPVTDPTISPDGVGDLIAKNMQRRIDEVTYLWSFNNTWTNVNLSSHYSQYIDGLRIGLSDESTKAALISEPNARIEDIDQDQFNTVMEALRLAISEMDLDQYEDVTFDDLFPPTIVFDIVYEDNTTLSLVFSKEERVIGVLNGTLETWQEPDPITSTTVDTPTTVTTVIPFAKTVSITEDSIDKPNIYYSFDDIVFLSVGDPIKFLQAINNFESLIYETFPVI